MNNILIIQTAFIGDVILATPVISELKRIFPNSKVDFLLKKGTEFILENNPNCSEVLIFDKKSGKFKEIKRLLKNIRGNQYDLVINLHRFGSSGILAGLSKAKLIYGFDKHPYSFLFTKNFKHEIGNGKHEVERNLELIKEFGAKSILRPELYPSKIAFENVLKYKTKIFYCIAPASVWFTKQMPFHKWIELIKKYQSKGNIYILGGKEDYDLGEKLIFESGSGNIYNLAGKLSITESAALMKDAKMNFVNDSGPLHIASAMNANVTAVFCSTTPEFGFGPLSDNSKIIEVQNLSCKPCGLHGHKSCPKDDFKCGNELDINLF